MGLASPNNGQRNYSRCSAECRACNCNTRQRNTTTYTRSQPFGAATDRHDVSRCTEDCYETRHKSGYGGYFGSNNNDKFPPICNRDGGAPLPSPPFCARDDTAVQSNPVTLGVEGRYPYEPVSRTESDQPMVCDEWLVLLPILPELLP